MILLAFDRWHEYCFHNLVKIYLCDLEQENNVGKLLFLTPELPWPPYSGGRIKSSKLVEHLHQRYQLDVGCLLKGDDMDHLPGFKETGLANRFISEAIDISRSPVNLLKSIQLGLPLNVYRTRSLKFASSIRACIDDYDAVFVDHYEMMQYIPSDFKKPVILHQHNAYYVLWESYARFGNGIGLRVAAWLESKRVKKYEAGVCNRADLVYAAPNDMNKLSEIGVEVSKLAPTMHLGDDRQLKLPRLKWDTTSRSLLYVGHLKWEPNVQGLLWFLNESWPTLNYEYPDLEFNIVGANPDQRLVELTSKESRVTLQGFQEDLEPWIKSSRVFIAPLLMGSGIKVKVINAMTRGIPTVTTSVGVEGLEVNHLRELAIADSAQEMTDHVSTLLGCKDTWERLALNSRRTAARQFTWKRTFDQMQRTLDVLIPGTVQEVLDDAA